MTPDTPKPSPNGAETPTKWVSVAQASAALCVSARAIQKRAARGTLAARKIERGGAAFWEIDGRELDASMRTNRREPANLAGEVDAPATAFDAQNGREPPANMDANPRTDGRENGREMDAGREADYRADVGFLRGMIEQLQRDGAETRAAVRSLTKALEKALELGSAPKELLAPAAQERTETSKNSLVAPTAPEPSKDPQNAAGMAGNVTYGDIANDLADWLESAQTSD